MRLRSFKLLSFLIFISVIIPWQKIYSAEKSWSGKGDAVSWDDANNWFPASAPQSSDDINIDGDKAAAVAEKDFYAGSIKVGGRKESSFTAENFVYGIIAPADNSEAALHTRKDGNIILKGAGNITLKGAFKNSEETLKDEPSFMFSTE